MPNYQLSKIYKIIDNTNGKVYYGSTCGTLSSRLEQHIRHFKNFKNNKYVSSHDILKNENYDIVLVELYPCNSRDELHMRERHWIENNECVNKNIPCRSKKEYYNSEKYKTYLKKNSEKNRDRDLYAMKQLYYYKKSWGGDDRSNNNLLRIDITLFN